MQVWTASLLLAEWCLHRSELLAGGVRVLELGAGVGLPAIVAASTGACCVATDCSEAALVLARKNALANAALIGRRGGSVTAAALHWDQACSTLEGMLSRTRAVNSEGCVGGAGWHDISHLADADSLSVCAVHQCCQAQVRCAIAP